MAQTFQDFEVIPVDDCSTDGSVNIVESYTEKFGDRLHLTRTEKFSDTGGCLPRNVGLNLAVGEYVYFIGANDFLAENALETLFNAAKENDAEVVYTAARHELNKSNNFHVMQDGKGKELRKKNLEDNAVLIIDEPAENIRRFFSEEDFCESCTKFVRREFLSANKIRFPEIPVDGEYIWSINVYCCAKRFLRLPTALYFYRVHLDVAPQIKRKPREQVSYWVSAFTAWLKTLNQLIYRRTVLQKNLSRCHEASMERFKYCLSQISDYIIKRFPSKDIYKILFDKLAGERNSFALMIPFFFSAIANREKLFAKTQVQLDNLTNEFNLQKKNLRSLKSSFRPAVSVIIPLYNAEKYVSECLDSILAQTFQNFEVIMVDDCSTDSSCKIVESYIPKFGGRLKLYHMPENTGSGALPRNKGLALSLGEYVFNMDNDDMITETALEELYTLAKKFDADVVYCEKYYRVDDDGSNIRVEAIQRGKWVDKPTFEPEDLNERVQRIIDERYWVVPWSKLIRRSVVVDNDIIFPGLAISDDNIWNQGLVFYAKKFLRVPNIIYIYRLSKNSILQKYKTPQKRINFWLNPVLLGLKSLDELMSRHEFFKENPACRYALLKKFIVQRFDWILSSSRKLPEEVVYEAIKNEYGKYFGDADVLVPCLCAHICEQNKVLTDAQAALARARANEQKAKDRITELKGVIARLKNGKGDLTTTPLPSVQFTCPAISVVIPMYNAGKFIGECLQSLLIQTFQDFEVIVVDDCSTDNSVEVVESYAPKFNGRLKLLSTKINSGGGGYVPRNLGMSLASGEYVFFSDADDFLLGSALETLYTAAKEYNTDVVYSSAHYSLKSSTDVRVSRDGRGKKLAESGIEDTLTLSVNEPEKTLHMLIFERGFSTPWTHFVRRDFLIRNKIVFPEIPKAGDYIWAIHIYCCAKRLLRLPTPLYFYNVYNPDSVAHAKQANQFLNWVLAFVAWSKALTELSDKVEIIKNNPAYSYEASKRYFEWCLNRTNDVRKQMSDQDVYEILYREFSKANDLSVAAVPFFFSFLDSERKANNDNLNTIDKLKKEIEQSKK